MSCSLSLTSLQVMQSVNVMSCHCMSCGLSLVSLLVMRYVSGVIVVMQFASVMSQRVTDVIDDHDVCQ